MTSLEIDEWLTHTLEDRRLSRNERQALAELVAKLGPQVKREAIRDRAFDIAREAMTEEDDQHVLDWLEDVLAALRVGPRSEAPSSIADVYFSPGDECLHAIQRLLRSARRTVDVCVFTITDDRLADALIDVHRRGVAIRIITDNAKAEDLGSDIGRFEEAGMAVRVDQSPFHMHHKFAVVDYEILLTGSYNWTRGAAHDNAENLIVTTETRLVSSFMAHFDRIWKSLA